ncbi:uncharacterized protein VTP21DRAFT_2966 [Calcarisporiella thermophila]|uniref:uncharacterized protein n=1 Tax=Calcarisporiella thermophila TaxID=911321 RepID=UPI0037433072
MESTPGSSSPSPSPSSPAAPCAYTIKVCSPTLDKHLDVTIPVESQVIDLKQVLCQSHPARPSPVDQRLIFKGKVLEDMQRLKDLIGSDTIAQTFHLVVKNSITTASSSTPISANTSISTSSSSTPPAQPASELRHRSVSPSRSTRETTLPASAASENQSHSSSANLSTSSVESSQSTSSHAQPENPPHPSPPSVIPIGSPFQWVLVNGALQLVQVHVSYLSHPAPSSTPLSTLNGYASYGMPMSSQPIPSLVQNPLILQQYSQQQSRSPQLQPSSPQSFSQQRQRQSERSIMAAWLAIKLAFFLFLFTQNLSLERALLMHLAALLFWLYQTGQLRVVVRRVPSGSHAQATQSHGASQFQPQQAPSPQQPPSSSVPDHSSQRHGFWGSLERLLVTFVTSLLPSESSTGLTPEEEAAIAAAGGI